MKKFQRIIAGVLFSVLLFLQCDNVVYATAIGDAGLQSSYDTYVSEAEARLVEIEQRGVSVSTGQYGLLSDLTNITEYAMYTDFLMSNKDAFGLSDAVIDAHLNALNSMMLKFNSTYGNESTRYASLSFAAAIEHFVGANVQYYLQTDFSGEVSGYVDNYMASIANEGNSIAMLKEKYASVLGVLYTFIDSTSSDAEIIGTWCATEGFTNTVATAMVSSLNSIKSNEAYTDMLQVGNSTTNMTVSNSVTVDTSLTFIENLANVSFDENDASLKVAKSPQLSLSYLAIFASSSVYTPFSSYTGCSEFTTALQSLADDGQGEDLLLLYNSVKTYKKPLYKRTLDSTGEPTGVATLITLQDFIDDINAGEIGALCTIIGALDNENGSWVYSQEGESQWSSDESVVSPYGGSTSERTMEGSDSAEPSEGASITDKMWNLVNGMNDIAYADVKAGFSASDDAELGTSGGNNIYAYESVTDESAMSEPVLLYGAKYSRATDNMTTAILTNIFKSTNGLDSIKDISTRYIYVNAFGDIVLDDDLVILPGAANPLFYRTDHYNPFTVAFMNSYPSVLKNTSYFKLASKSDIGKYVFFGNYDYRVGSVTDYIAARTTSIETISPTAPLSVSQLECSFSSNLGLDRIKVFKTRRLIFGASDDWDEDNQFFSYTPLLNSVAITINGNNVFPYVASEDSSGVVAKAIAQNVFTYLAVNEDTSELDNQKMINNAYMLDALIINCLYGTDNATGYQNDSLLEYDTYASNEANRKYNTLKDISNNIFNSVGKASGLIGVKSVYDNKIVATVLNAIRSNWLMFFFLVVIVILFYFSKARLDLLQSCVFMAVMVFGAYMYVSVLPSLLPSFFNLVTNNVSQNLSYEILSLDAEHYSFDDNYTNLDSDGYFDYDSTSIDLYRVQGADRSDFLSSMNVDADDITGGNITVLNKDAGIYAKNDSICVNTNILFDTLKIEGSLTSSYAYTLSAKKTVSSNVDYYIPYYQIVDQLIEKVNGIAETYSIPRRTLTYANGKTKNNYLLYSYVNSKPFVTPGEYDYVIPTSELDWTEEELAAYKLEGDDIAAQLEELYGSNADWLGISNFLYELTEAEQKTLWAQTMRDLGYYHMDWTPNTEKLDDLVTYVNYQTRKFVLDMSSQIGYLSDDVMIKVVSMRALIALTQRVSDFGHWMYPFAINYEDMTIENVMQSVMISQYDKYLGMNMDVVDYVFTEYGWIHLVVFDVLNVLLFLLVSLINITVPLFYLILGVLIIFRLCKGQGFREPLFGYLKVSVILLVCSTLLTLSILGARAMTGSAIAIYFMLCMCLLIFYILLNMLLSVVRNFTELGNTALNVNIENKINNIKHLGHNIRHKNFKTQNLIYKKQTKIEDRGRGMDRYNLEAGVEDFYDSTYGGFDEEFYDYDSQEEYKEGSVDYEEDTVDLTDLDKLENLDDLTDDLN